MLNPTTQNGYIVTNDDVVHYFTEEGLLNEEIITTSYERYENSGKTTLILSKALPEPVNSLLPSERTFRGAGKYPTTLKKIVLPTPSDHPNSPFRFDRVSVRYCLIEKLIAPEGIKEVSCGFNIIQDMELSEGVKSLFCASNLLRSIDPPRSLKKLAVRGNPLLRSMELPEDINLLFADNHLTVNNFDDIIKNNPSEPPYMVFNELTSRDYLYSQLLRNWGALKPEIRPEWK